MGCKILSLCVFNCQSIKLVTKPRVITLELPLTFRALIAVELSWASNLLVIPIKMTNINLGLSFA